MTDCRTECPGYCAAKAAVESNVDLYWAQKQFDEAVQRSQMVTRLAHLNSIGILTDDEYSFLGAQLPAESSAEGYRLDQERINVLAAYAMNCTGMQYRVNTALGYVMGSEKVCPNENIWRKYL